LAPFSTQPSPTRSARVCIAPSTSVPPPGSVMESAKTHSPRVMRGRKNSFCASLPKKPMDLPPKHTVLK